MLLKKLTKHNNIAIVNRGNSAILSALKIIKDGDLIIPKEGGWLTYQDYPKKLGINVHEVECDDAVININNLKEILENNNCSAIIYHQPGGYFAPQKIKEIYEICKKYHCLIIMDVCGSIGTELCDGNYADIMIGSFRKWKIANAGCGGFISTKNKELFDKLEFEELKDKECLKKIKTKLENINQRIDYLQSIKNKVISDLSDLNILKREEFGFVVIIKYTTLKEKERIINYCKDNELDWTECPRYIRLMDTAISIEIKRK